MRRASTLTITTAALISWISGCVADPPDFASTVSSDAGAAGSGDGGNGASSSDGSAVSAPTSTGDGGSSVNVTLAGSCTDIDGGSNVCSGSTPVCCAVQNPAGGYESVTFACSASNESCTALDAGVAITCRGPKDCPSGTVCCGRTNPSDDVVFTSVGCESSCDGKFTALQATFCDPSDPHTCDGTNSGTTPYCEESDDFPGMFECSSE